MNKNKPNLFIVGAAKAGTTSIYRYLKAHPDVYMSPIKEPLFFGSDIKWAEFRLDHKQNTYFDGEVYFSEGGKPLHIAKVEKLTDYEKLFQKATTEKYLGEASTSYLYSENAAKEIYTYNPEAKIVMILRSPVDRTISHYSMDVAGGKQNGDNPYKEIKEDYESKKKGYCISNLYIDLSLYYEQIKRYEAEFPKEQLLILSFDELKSNPQKVVKQLYDFLNIAKDESVLNKVGGKHNSTTVPKNRLIKFLKEHQKYIPHLILDRLKDKKELFFKKNEGINIDNKLRGYIKDKAKEDWEKTKKLIENIKCKQ